MKKKLRKELKLKLKGYKLNRFEVIDFNSSGELIDFKVFCVAEKQPTKEELLEKAKRDYVDGVKLKSVILTKIIEREKLFNRGIKFIYQNGRVIAQDKDCNSGGVTIYQNGQWAEILAKPILKLNNKWMYEGDEVWFLSKLANWRLSKKQVYDANFENNDNQVFFLTKQEALDYVLKEAKDRFKGNKATREGYFDNEDCNDLKSSKTHSGVDNIVLINEGNTNYCIWRADKGWIAKPIKQPKLMLGSEEVEIEEKVEWKDAVIRPGIIEEYAVKKIVIHCKDGSITKEGWMKFYKKFHKAKKYADSFVINVDLDIAIEYEDGKISIGCIDDVKLAQIEAITKALNEL